MREAAREGWRVLVHKCPTVVVRARPILKTTLKMVTWRTQGPWRKSKPKSKKLVWVRKEKMHLQCVAICLLLLVRACSVNGSVNGSVLGSENLSVRRGRPKGVGETEAKPERFRSKEKEFGQ